MTDLSSARLYLVSTARIAAGLLVDFVPQLASAGVDLIQLREKEMEAGDVIAAAVPIADACRAAGVPFIVNDRADIAVAVGADGVHVGQNDLPVGAARSIVGDRIVGLSTHRPEEVDAATTSGADYFAVGPVYETPTKLGRPGVGLELIEHAASIGGTAPWFAIGGIDPGNLRDVVAAGATRIVVVRAITEASDPVAATAELRRILDR